MTPFKDSIGDKNYFKQGKRRKPLMKRIEIALLAIAALLSIAACTHTGKTLERSGNQDCLTCTATGPQGANAGGDCGAKKSDTIYAWCKCNAKNDCKSDESQNHNQTYHVKNGGRCGRGAPHEDYN